MAKDKPPSSKYIRAFYRRLAKRFGYSVVSGHTIDRTTLEKEGVPIIVGCDTLRDHTISVSLYIRTTSWDFDGERTDLHEVLSILICCILRTFGGGVSCRLWDVANPAVEVPQTEIYARYLTLDQPVGLVFSFDGEGFDLLASFLKGLLLCEFMLPQMLACTEHKLGAKEPHSYDFQGATISRWAKVVASALNQNSGTNNVQYNLRRNPCWLYYRSLRPRTSVIFNRRIALGLRALLEGDVAKDWKSLRGRHGMMLLSGATRSFVAFAVQGRAKRILNALGDRVRPQDVRFIPLDNYCIAVGSRHVLIIRGEYGREAFEKERELLRDRHRQESTLLFPPSKVVWNSKINDAEFEAMIHELLLQESGVLWVRKMGHTNEPDGGRDFIAEWDTRPVPGQILMKGESPVVRRRVVVQCKASGRAVGKAHVRDIYDLLKRYDASGFFLATSSYVTAGLIEHLEKIRYRERYWSDWWTKTEIEERLLKNEDVALRYPSLLTIQR